MSKLNDAMRELQRDQFEISLRKDPEKLSQYRQVKAEARKAVLTDEPRSEVTGY